MKILLALLVSVSAFATEISFTHFGNNSGNQSYYACSYAEDQTMTYLELFGATNIDVRCSGGISNWSMQPVSVRAKFDLPVVTGSAVDATEIQGDTWSPACALNVQIIKELLKVFTNVEVLKKSDACAFANSNYYYKLNIVR